MANEPITATDAGKLNKMCQMAKDTFVGSVLRTLAVEATVSSSITAIGSLIAQHETVSVCGTIINGGSAVDRVYSIFRAPVGGTTTIDAVDIVTSTTVTTHAADYWTMTLFSPTNSNSLIAAAQTTVNSAFTAGVAYSMGTLTNNTLTAGDVVQIAFTNAASAPTSNTTVFVSWRQE